MATEAFVVLSKTSKKEGYCLGVLIFGRDIILPIKHRLDWKLLHQIKYTKINRDNNCENKHRVDYDYKSVDKVMLTYQTSYIYETPYKGPFLTTQCFTNDTVDLQYGPTKIRHNIRNLKTYKLDT